MKLQLGYLSTSIETALFNAKTYKIVLLLLLLIGGYVSWALNDIGANVASIIFNNFLEGIALVLFLLLFKKQRIKHKFLESVYRSIYYFIPVYLLYSTIIYGYETFLNLFLAFSILFFGFITHKKSVFILFSIVITTIFGFFIIFTPFNLELKLVIFTRLVAFNVISFLIINYKINFIKKLVFYENIFNNVFNDLRNGFLLVENDSHKIVLSNNTVTKLSILKNQDILGKELYEVINNSYLKENLEFIFKQSYWEREMEIDQLSNYWIKLTIYDVDMDKTYKICKVENISSQKQAEKLYDEINYSDKNVSNSVLIINSNYVVEYANEQYVSFSGLEKEEIVGKTLNDQQLRPLSGFPNFYKTLSSGQIWEGEFERNKKNGDIVYEKIVATPFAGKEDNISHYVLNFEDITISKKIEQAFKHSEQFNKRLTKAIPDLLIVFDQDANIVDLVDNNENVFKIDIANFKGINISYLLEEDFKKKTIAKIASIEAYNEVEIYEYDVNDPISGKIFFEVRLIVMEKDRYLAAIRNITDEKIKENLLKETQQRYYTLFSKANDAILIIENYKIIECNNKALDVFELEREEIINVNPADLSPTFQEDGQLSSEKAPDFINKALFGEPQFFVWQHKRKNGEVFAAQISLNSFFVGYKGYVQVILRDITAQQTQQKELERITRVLQENERRLSTLMNNLPGMAYRRKNDQDWTMEFVNWGSFDIAGYTPDEIINNNKISYNSLIHTDDRKMVWDEVQMSILRKRPYKLNYRLVSPKNEIKWVWEQGEAVYDYSNNVIALEGFITDITKEKEFEIDLLESQQKYYKLFNEAFDSILIMQNGVFIDCNEKTLEMFECKKNDIVGSSIQRIIPDKQHHKDSSLALMNNVIDQTLAGRPQFAMLELMKKTGTLFSVEMSISSFELEQNSYLQFFIRDITDRINAENKIAASEKNNRNLIESSPMGIIITNLNKVFYINNSAVSILGFEKEDQLKDFNLTKLVSKESGMSIIDYLRSVNKSMDDNEFMEVTLKHPFNDTDIEIEAKAVLFDYNGTKAYQIVLRDVSIQKRLIQEKLRSQMVEEHNQKLLSEVTERIKAEEQLTTSLQEKELLLKEVHHRVKNNMQIISSILNLQASYIKDPDTKTMFQESQDRIKSMALIHESLYRNENLALINFKDYISNLVNNLYRSYGVDYNIIKSNLEIEEILFNLDTGIPCGLIINEIISNSFKYAFPELKEGSITVKLHTNKDEVHLFIADNGIGINKKLDIYNTNSLGLQLVTTLVDQIDGTMELKTDEGTQYKIIFKK